MYELANHELSISLETSMPFGECLMQLREMLMRTDLRIVAEIPFHREFEHYLGMKWRRYTVVVVWSPFEAYQSVLNDPEAGILLPFHFVVAETPTGTLLAATNLSLLGQLSGRVGLRLVGANVTHQIQQILDQLRARWERSTDLTPGDVKESS